MEAQPKLGPIPDLPDGEAPAVQRRELAIAQLRKKKAFKTHLAAYLTVNTALVVIWAALAGTGSAQFLHIQVSPDHPLPTGFFWPIFPILGWGVGLIMHWYSAYRTEGYTEGQIRREMARLP